MEAPLVLFFDQFALALAHPFPHSHVSTSKRLLFLYEYSRIFPLLVLKRPLLVYLPDSMPLQHSGRAARIAVVLVLLPHLLMVLGYRIHYLVGLNSYLALLY
jgi:hypothetical protein